MNRLNKIGEKTHIKCHNLQLFAMFNYGNISLFLLNFNNSDHITIETSEG